MTVARPEITDQAPIARPRSSPEKLVETRARAPGTSRLAAAPWNSRAMMRTAPVGATPQTAEVTPKATAPARKTRPWPSTSPTALPRSTSPASVIR